MDFKAIAQKSAEEVLAYNQDISDWKVVKSSVREKYFSRVYFFNDCLL